MGTETSRIFVTSFLVTFSRINPNWTR